MKKTLILAAGAVLALSLTGCNMNASSGKKINTASSGITIGETTYSKTSEVYVVPAGKTATIAMENDSSWSGFVGDSDSIKDFWKGVFLKGRKVKLSSFIMSQYEVTQELYNAVMGTNPSSFTSNAAEGETQKLRPVECVTHYQAAAFCNELTKKTMAEEDLVYYSDSAFTTAYTTADAGNKVKPYMNPDKKGYRLPTEAEWEYAARGGNPTAEAWGNAFGKVTTKNNAKIYDGSTYLYEDENLATVGWYYGNSGSKTHEVGKKDANSLGLYDMCGNVWEWCWDWYADDAASEDARYTTDGTAVNPLGPSLGSFRVRRGGSWNDIAFYCSVSCRFNFNPVIAYSGLGFRLVRSAQ